VAARLALIAGLLLLALAGTANAHESSASHIDTPAELADLDIAESVEAAEAVNGAAEGDGLPTTWCGTPRTTDDITNNAFDPNLPQFKVVYAYPADGADRFSQWKDALQANVSLIGRFMGAQSGGRKAPRFDMGTSCGPEYVDIQVIQLPGTRAAYVDDFDALQVAVEDRLSHGTDEPRNVMVLADTLSGTPPGYIYGLGAYYGDDRPGAQNVNNVGGVFATLWVPNGQSAPGVNPDGWWPEGMLHEMTHNLGAVQESAPHATTAGHCTDGYDLMCYDDGSIDPFPLTVDCPEIAGVMTQRYDCGSDDYFNVAPATGTYLATHWNVYDNVFLGSCAGVAPACGGTTSVAPVPPAATSNPEVFGTPRAGVSLTATRGVWINQPVSYEYRWERGDGITWSQVSGATGQAYTPVGSDVGQRLRVRVIATNGDGSTAAYSAQTDPVAAAAGTPIQPGDGTATPIATGSPTTPTTTTTVAARRAKGSAALKVALGRGKGKRLGTIGFSLAGGKLTSSRTRIRLAKGRYELMLCTTAGASATQPRCVKRRVSAKSGVTRLPALSVGMADGVEGRASYAVTAVGRLFAARTAKRPRQGVVLRG
jgi:hypothetical protein